MSKQVEKAIQKAVIAWVKETYPHIIITTTANERSYKEVEQIGSLGIPDLILFSPLGDVLFLELKTNKGELQPSQIEWNKVFDDWRKTAKLERAVAYGFAEAREIIKDWYNKFSYKMFCLGYSWFAVKLTNGN